VVTEAATVAAADLDAVRECGGSGLPVFRADLRGDVAAVHTT
jgi:hypothetical protein